MASRIPSRLRYGQRIPLAIQLVNLKRMFPASVGSVDGERLRWSYDKFQASPVSGVYRIEIEGRLGMKPAIWLSGDAINEGNINESPHHYAIDAEGLRIRICLDRFDWKPHQLYSSTYIPWAMEWIVFFEIWCATGVWSGGGIHPQLDQPSGKAE